MPGFPNAPKRLLTAVVFVALGLGTPVAGPACARAAGSGVQTFSAKLSSGRAGTNAKPAVVGLTLSTGQTTPAGAPKVPLLSANFDFPSLIRFQPDMYRYCTRWRPHRWCTTREKDPGTVASGNATLAFGDVAQTLETGFDFTGPNSSEFTRATPFTPNAVVWARHAGDSALPATSYRFPARYSRRGGRARLFYEVSPDAQQPVAGTPGEFTNFTLAFPKRAIDVRVRTSESRARDERWGLVELRGCPKGGLVFKGTFEYVDDTTTMLRSTVPCTKA